MALATSTGAEVQRPLANVVIGGLITYTFLTCSYCRRFTGVSSAGELNGATRHGQTSPQRVTPMNDTVERWRQRAKGLKKETYARK